MIKENHEVIVAHHPYFKSLNQKLLKDLEGVDYSLSYQTNIQAKMTSWNVNSSACQIIYTWIRAILMDYYPWLKNHDLYDESTWFAKYDKGDYTKEHNHFPAAFSWTYYIKCPKGSSPLVFSTSGKRMKAEEGKILIFPGCLKHHVPKNRCDNRIVVAGNLNAR